MENSINMGVNFISSNDTGEIRTFFVRSDNEEIRRGNETNDIINKLVEFFLSNYQDDEKILRNGSSFVFESVDLLAYHIHKTNLKRGKSQIKSPEWILNKKATINPKNKDNKCFQYAVTVALIIKKLENIQKEYQILNSLLINIIGKFWNFPLGIKDWKKFEQNNKTVSLNILYEDPNTKKINPAYKSKYNRILKENLFMNLGATQQIQLLHLIQSKTSTAFVEEKIALKCFLKI